MKPCNGKFGTCKNTIEHNKKFCPDCIAGEKQRQKTKTKEYDEDRGTAAERGYDAVWAKLRKLKLRISPLCECPDCQSGYLRIRSANMVHHIKEIETHPELRLVMSNLLSMKRECHERLHGRKR
jgi:5-methylcytosine-specific restriction protein A